MSVSDRTRMKSHSLNSQLMSFSVPLNFRLLGLFLLALIVSLIISTVRNKQPHDLFCPQATNSLGQGIIQYCIIGVGRDDKLSA